MPVEDVKVRPIKGNHSIKAAIVNVFLVNPILKPERFQKLIEGDLRDSFQKFEPISVIEFQFGGRGLDVLSTGTQINKGVGFKFSSFEKGETKKILQGINEEKKISLSFHDLNYSRWANFYNDCIKSFSSLLNVQSDLFVRGFGLQYIDEFLWMDRESEIDQSMIFKESCDYLPKTFFSSIPSNYSLATEDKTDQNQSYDILEIKFERRIRKQIKITHNFVQPLKDIVDLKTLIESQQFKLILDTAHNHNKSLLKELLADNILKMINLHGK